MSVITLIGYRGTGKTSIAPLLAERFRWQWLDADVEIERVAGRTIAQIFADPGEPEFRRIEAEVLQDLLGRDNLVIAAGGGAVLNVNTQSRMQSAGPVVWLMASVDTILSRINRDPTTADRRPALTNAVDQRAEIEQLLKIRIPVYESLASLIIDTEGKSPTEITAEIIAGL